MEYGLLVLSASVVGGGVLGALVRAWSVSARLYSIESRVNALEGGLLREQKIRASEVRWRKASKEEEQIEAALERQPAPRKQWFWQQFPKHPTA